MKIAEQTLLTSEEKFKKAFFMSPIGMELYDMDGLLIDCNEACLKMFGVDDKKKVLGFNLFNDPNLTPEQIRDIKEGKNVEFEIIFDFEIVKKLKLYETIKTGKINLSGYSTLIRIQGEKKGILIHLIDITDRKKAELALKESEQKFRKLFEMSGVGVAQIDVKTFRLINANKKFAEMLGYEPEDLKHSTLARITHPDDLDESIRKIRKLGKMLEEYSFEKRYVRKNGSIFWALVTVSIGEPENAEPFMIAVIQDISALKNAAQVLKEENERFRTTMDAIDSVVYVADIQNFDLLFINSYTRKLFGDIEGKKCYAALQEKNSPCEFCTNKLLFNKDGNPAAPYIWEFQNLITKRWFQCHDQAIRWPDGRYVRFEIANDITADKEIKEALKDSKEKLELALASGNIGIWDWNMKTDEFFCDAGTLKMFGAGDASRKVTFEDFLNMVNDEDVSHLSKAIQNALNGNLPLDTIFRTKTGDREGKYINTKARLYKDDNGKPSRMLGVNIDITEMKNRTEKILFSLNEELLRSNSELQSFAYVASHDLKEPLRMVASYTQLLAQRYKDRLDKEGMEFIQFAVAGVHRMYDLINAILSYSRLQTREKILTAVNMGSLLENISANIAAAEPDRKISISWDPLPKVYADISQMTLLLQNLVSNAIKFSKENPVVSVACLKRDDYWIFSIKDNGIGIEEKYFSKIFQIFQRLHTRGEYPGTGIGLTICKRIVELHGGEIWLESQPGAGSTFYFSLPVKQEKTSTIK